MHAKLKTLLHAANAIVVIDIKFQDKPCLQAPFLFSLQRALAKMEVIILAVA